MSLKEISICVVDVDGAVLVRGTVLTETADRLRTLIGARERLIRQRKDLEGHIRGVLKT